MIPKLLHFPTHPSLQIQGLVKSFYNEIECNVF
jgi:hypothetical protein